MEMESGNVPDRRVKDRDEKFASVLINFEIKRHNCVFCVQVIDTTCFEISLIIVVSNVSGTRNFHLRFAEEHGIKKFASTDFHGERYSSIVNYRLSILIKYP